MTIQNWPLKCYDSALTILLHILAKFCYLSSSRSKKLAGHIKWICTVHEFGINQSCFLPNKAKTFQLLLSIQRGKERIMREKKRERVKIIFPDRFVCLLSFKLFIVHRFYLNWTFLKAKAFVYNALYKIVYPKSYQRSQDLYNSCYHPPKKVTKCKPLWGI